MHRDRAHGCRIKPWPHVRIMGEASKIPQWGYGTAVLAVSAVLMAQASLASSPELPKRAPVPIHAPASKPSTETTGPESAPVPAPRPDEMFGPPAPLPKAAEVPVVKRELFGPPAPPPKTAADLPVKREMFGPPAPLPKAVEIPPSKHETFGPPAPSPKIAAAPPVRREMFGPPMPLKAPMPRGKQDADDLKAESTTEEEIACREDLHKLGAEFSEHPPLADVAVGCLVVNPVTLKSLGKAIKLSPDAVLNCDMARTTIRFMQDVAVPIAKTSFGVELTSISHASAYVCRPRNGTLTISEHALGNAIDIASFGLADGTRVDVKAGAEPKQAGFLDAVRKAACGPFKTVLGPGTNADHETHFHFDLEKRRSGATYCH